MQDKSTKRLVTTSSVVELRKHMAIKMLGPGRSARHRDIVQKASNKINLDTGWKACEITQMPNKKSSNEP